MVENVGSGVSSFGFRIVAMTTLQKISSDCSPVVESFPSSLFSQEPMTKTRDCLSWLLAYGTNKP